MTTPTLPPPDYPTGTAHLSDAAFVAAFETCTLPGGAFRHYDHIRLAWIYLKDHTYRDATERMVDAIRRFALYHGATTKYHDTMTRFWMRLVAHAQVTSGIRDDFPTFAAGNPRLFDKRRVFDFYTDERLFSRAARAGWVEPDIIPLPDPEPPPALSSAP